MLIVSKWKTIVKQKRIRMSDDKQEAAIGVVKKYREEQGK
jgi:hypothetical protein